MTCAQGFIYKVYLWPFPYLIFPASRSGWLVLISLNLRSAPGELVLGAPLPRTIPFSHSHPFLGLVLEPKQARMNEKSYFGLAVAWPGAGSSHKAGTGLSRSGSLSALPGC